MIAIGMGLLWAAYAMGMKGWVLVRGYNLGWGQLVSPTGYYKGKWPPALAGNAVIIPNGTAADTRSAATTAAATGVATSVPGSPASVANPALIQQVAAGYGWGKGAQYSALTHLIAMESGGNPQIKNKSSGAFGIAQALGHGRGAATQGSLANEYGGYGLTDAQAQQANSGVAKWQLVWMMNYIKATYGSPVNAWAHEMSTNPHWY